LAETIPPATPLLLKPENQNINKNMNKIRPTGLIKSFDVGVGTYYHILYGKTFKRGGYKINFAGYSRDDIDIEHIGNNINIVAHNEKYGKREYSLTVGVQEVEKVTLDNGLLEIKLKTFDEKVKKIRIE